MRHLHSFSPSAISTFHECSLKWALSRWGAPSDGKSVSLLAGVALHAALAFVLKGQMNGRTPTDEEALELLEAELFAQECSSVVVFGKTPREAILATLRGLYLHWKANWKLEGEIVAVEQPIAASFPGIPVPFHGIPDLVIRTAKGVEIIDWKVVSRRSTPDDLFDSLELAKLAYSRSWEVSSGEEVVKFSKVNLLKTKAPAIHLDEQAVRPEDRDRELRRLTLTVAPTIDRMEAILRGDESPVPTTSFARMCGSCPWRQSCWAYQGRPPAEASATPLGAAAAPAASA